MANIYVRSTDGNDADNGSTWALAKATLAGVAAITTAGDTVWVSHNHAESTAALIALAWGGTAAAPIRILCGNDAVEPPTALATTGVVATSGANDIRLSPLFSGTDHIYIYGLTFRAGVGSSTSGSMILDRGSSTQHYEKCVFEIAATGTTNTIGVVGAGAYGEMICTDCDFKLAHADQYIDIRESAATIRGGSLLIGTSPTNLFRLATSAFAHIDGFDMSNANAAINMAFALTTGWLRMRNCRLPASWSGSMTSNAPTSGGFAELNNSVSSDSTYQYQRITEFGSITGEKTVVRSGGASDGVRAISWKMATNANPAWNHLMLFTEKITRWNNTVGSPITATIEILHDSVTNMTNQQIWLEVQYLGTSGSPLSSFVNDSSGDYLSTATDQADSSANWTTTGLTNPNTQKLSVTFTPQEKGFISAVVKMTMASKTVYVCPKLEIS